MNCETAQRLMHLNGEGERSRDELHALEVHLEQCEECASEYAAIPSADARLYDLIGAQPVLERPWTLTERILRAVSGGAQDRRAVRGGVQRWLRILPPMRLAAAVAGVVLIGSMLLQMYRLQERSRAFEQRLVDRSRAQRPVEMVYGLRYEDVEKVTEQIPTDGVRSFDAANTTKDELVFNRIELRDALGRMVRVRVNAPRRLNPFTVDAEEFNSLVSGLVSRVFLTMRTGVQGEES